MKTLIPAVCLVLVAASALAGSYVTTVQVIPEHPDPGEPVILYFAGDMPDGCWSQGGQTDSAFTLIDSQVPGISCTLALVPFEVWFELGGLPEGQHWRLIHESHSSMYQQGVWTHEVRFTVGDPPVADEPFTWGRVKALYR